MDHELPEISRASSRLHGSSLPLEFASRGGKLGHAFLSWSPFVRKPIINRLAMFPVELAILENEISLPPRKIRRNLGTPAELVDPYRKAGKSRRCYCLDETLPGFDPPDFFWPELITLQVFDGVVIVQVILYVPSTW